MKIKVGPSDWATFVCLFGFFTFTMDNKGSKF
jgi:hypothetical protein